MMGRGSVNVVDKFYINSVPNIVQAYHSHEQTKQVPMSGTSLCVFMTFDGSDNFGEKSSTSFGSYSLKVDKMFLDASLIES